MAVNVDAMLRAAVEAYRAGNKAAARALLDKVLEVDEYNENAWMWMSAAVDTPEEQRTCLENVLVINPKNEKARMGMKSLGFDPDSASSAPAAPSAASASVFTANDFGGDSGGASVWDDDASPTASSSASSTSFRGSDASNSDLDSWISGMGIGSAPKQPSLAPTPHPFSDAIIGDDIEDDDISFDEFDDRMNNMFNEDEFDVDTSAPSKPAPARSSSPASRPIPPASFSSPSIFDEEEDDGESPFDDDIGGMTDEDFDDFNAMLSEPPSAAPAPSRPSSGRQSPGRDSSPRPSARAAAPAREEADAGTPPEPAQLFAMIPKEVEVASRLPGEDEESPRPLLIGVIVLFVLNLAALGFLLMNAA